MPPFALPACNTNVVDTGFDGLGNFGEMSRRGLAGQVGRCTHEGNINAPQNELQEGVFHHADGEAAIFGQQGGRHIPTTGQDQGHGPTVRPAAFTQQVPRNVRDRVGVLFQQPLRIHEHKGWLSTWSSFQLVELVQRPCIIRTAAQPPHGVCGIKNHTAGLQCSDSLDGILAPRRLLQCFRRHVATLS